MLKKATFAILSLMASSLVSAGTMGPTCVPGDVTVPCEVKKWDIGVQALYLEPVYGLHHGYTFHPIGTIRDIENDWDWGYRLEGSYHFNTGNDITITWLHYDNEFDSSGYAGFTPFTGTLLIPFNISHDERFDQVNLVMGQHVDMGLLKNARFYAGLQYARVRIDRDHVFSIPVPFLAPDGFTISRDTDFNGVGPVVGIDYAYDLAHGFSITANTAGSILYGSSRLNNNLIFAPSGLVPINIYASKKSIVPSLEAKLGLNYAHEFAQGVFNIEGGYQVLNYFNVLQVTGFPINTLENVDFGLYGPYLGVKWVGYA
ncbi:major outer membrane protein [Legionella lansingensis]|uniref:Outer membrane protein n=1 Tax=Legionella lansingensis TaxID=45067 RepID=A0A0W0VSZ0_9GAMM|nr:Lpg1974 family pore-forming outer membrane protein [Legionella lansingensis]KTD22758.1 outer membrane protein [Legionella lansingensis]SNV56962.1 major outer membrane protein [Legionella lansingensis]